MMLKVLKYLSSTIWIAILLLFLGLLAYIGDNIVLRSATKFKRAFADSCTHGLIGLVTWLVICVYFKRPYFTSLCEICICGFLSSLIDVDHFVAAKSFKLEDALSLSSRPFLHCSSIPFITVVSLILLCHALQLGHLSTLSWMLLVAFTSHHIRDAARHGLWLWPFGSTPPLNYFLYIALTMCLPLYIIIFMNFINFSSKPYKYILEVWWNNTPCHDNWKCICTRMLYQVLYWSNTFLLRYWDKLRKMMRVTGVLSLLASYLLKDNMNNVSLSESW